MPDITPAPGRRLRVLLADDQALVRAGIRQILDTSPDIEVVGEAADGRETLERYAALRPDVALVDLVMPNKDGLDVTRELRAHHPDARVLILSLHMDGDYAERVLRAGAMGAIGKDVDPEELVDAVRRVANGERYLEPGMEPSGSVTELSDRELQVLRLLVDGVKNRDIASRLHVSTKTVDSHRANILRKLDLSSNAELVRYAIRHGLIVA